MKKFIFITLAFVTISLGLSLFLRIFYSETNTIEYKLFNLYHGHYLYKIIGRVPPDVKYFMNVSIKEKAPNFCLYQIIDRNIDDKFLYIKFDNEKAGFIKGFIGDPKKGNGNYLCESINLILFNEYIASLKIKSHHFIINKFFDLLKESDDTLCYRRIKSINDMRFFLKGTQLRTGNNNDTLELSKLNLPFDNDLIYWFRYRGFFKFNFVFFNNNELKNVDCKEIGQLDCTLLHL